MYKIKGNVKDINGNPISRTVKALDRDSKATIVQTLSNPITGDYTLYLTNDTPVIVMCEPDSGDSANLYLYDNIIPESVGAVATDGTNDIGVPGTLGFGVGTAPVLLAGMTPLNGYDDINSENYGNYRYDLDGSIMVWIPAFWYKWGTGSNGVDLNEIEIKAYDEYVDEATANADGFAIHRAFYDGGAIKSGVFVDKYMCSINPNASIASSLKYGNPVSLSPSTPNVAQLGPYPNQLSGAIDAAKTRGTDFFCTSRFIYGAIAFLSYAHARSSTNTEFCGWYMENYNFPKGVTNTAGRDTLDSNTETYPGDYNYRRKTGSMFPLEKNTHNGQLSGITDVSGNMGEVSPGLSYESSQYRVLKTSVAMKDVTGGTTLATDLWGATGVANLYDAATNTYGALDGTASYRYPDPTVQTFSEDLNGLNWALSGLAIPVAGALSTTNHYRYGGGQWTTRTNLCAALTSGYWGDGENAGVFALHLSGSRTYSSAIGYYGFRLSAYVP